MAVGVDGVHRHVRHGAQRGGTAVSVAVLDRLRGADRRTFLSSLAGSVYEAPGTGWVFAALLGGTFSYIAWALWRYVSALDELGRRVQMEAVAITYLIGRGCS